MTVCLIVLCQIKAVQQKQVASVTSAASLLILSVILVKTISKNAEQLSYSGKMVLNHPITSVLNSYKILYYITSAVEENTEDEIACCS